jgi:hypothetical protein
MIEFNAAGQLRTPFYGINTKKENTYMMRTTTTTHTNGPDQIRARVQEIK